jgi:hypothetical protein
MRSKAEIKTSPEKPPLCKVDLQSIPDVLKQFPRWVLWKWIRKKGEWTKVTRAARETELCKRLLKIARLRDQYLEGDKHRSVTRTEWKSPAVRVNERRANLKGYVP